MNFQVYVRKHSCGEDYLDVPTAFDHQHANTRCWTIVPGETYTETKSIRHFAQQIAILDKDGKPIISTLYTPTSEMPWGWKKTDKGLTAEVGEKDTVYTRTRRMPDKAIASFDTLDEFVDWSLQYSAEVTFERDTANGVDVVGTITFWGVV